MRAFAFCSLLAFAAAAPAQEGEIDSGVLDEALLPDIERAGGVIVDRTATHFGAEFVRAFSEVWREQASASETVTIIERPSARHGSLVWVEHNNRPVARVFLYAGRSGTIRSLGHAAARHVARQVSDDALARLLLHDPDLAKDGF